MRGALFLLAGLVFFLVTDSFAETKAGSVGRYADGRAYRVDHQGYQLSDQIAELEATIKEQESQISSCENQLATKGSSAKASQCPKIDCPVVPLVKTPITAPPTAELCAPFISTLNREVADLRLKLSNAPRPEQIGALSEESIQLRQALSATEESAKRTAQSLELNLKSEKEKLLQLETANLAEKTKLSQLETTNRELSSKVSELSSEIGRRNKRESELLASIDNMSEQLVNFKVPATQSPTRAMLENKSRAESPAPIEVVEEESNETKTTIVSKLSEIQRLVMKRKDIFDSVRASKKGITIQMQQLVTENGASLDQLRQRANSESPDFGKLSQGLSEIKNILISDIQVMERLIQRL